VKLARVSAAGRTGIAVNTGNEVLVSWDDVPTDEVLRSAGIKALIDLGTEIVQHGEGIDPETVTFLPPLPHPRKIICVGLNYKDHADETGFQVPQYPTLFARFDTTLIGHGQPVQSTPLSNQLDFEGEMVAVIGSVARNVSESSALDAICAYSVFNDVSVRDFQMKSPQWTAGKNFDATGAFGPWLVTADEVPAGGRGLHIETRLNGEVVQSASTTDLIFDVATLVSTLSQFMTLEPGDVIVTGTPSGVGMSRDPQLWMRPGDVVEVEVEGIGLLRNPIV
jgi:2-keto-4-pentenoate hydratase/2-oxohepta-3-ene-1,7-dioic acid hydratase in catechol pathway